MKNITLIFFSLIFVMSCSMLSSKECPIVTNQEAFLEACLLSLAVYTRSREIPQDMIQYCVMVYGYKKSGQAKLQLIPVPIHSIKKR